jgi:hypothetical protein
MRHLLLLCCIFLLSGGPQAALINVDSKYRVTEVKVQERIFGIALLGDDPNETQNEVYFGADTRCYREIHFGNGTRKEIPVTIEKFFKILRRGDTVRVKGGRDWDGSIHGYDVRIITRQ